MEVLSVIRKKNRQPQQNEQRVTGKCARLEEADGEAEELRQLGAEVEQPVDDPLVPPHGKRRAKAREPASAVYADAVDDYGVELAERGAEVLGAVHEEGVVNFVDVVFVHQQPVQPWEFCGAQFRSESLRAIEPVRQENSSGGNPQRRG